ncbi:energy transducer TonB [Flavobacterium terrisoli]|uniref:energy transducer TonB n=1 Tax=Flavobacterium terrisoli TaxID=3242195 RepID=UPI002543AA7D|nr:energy transducer TonB [Flavobacterium buctense]
MKKYFLSALFVLVCSHGFSQNVIDSSPVQENDSEDNNIYNTAGVEKKPEYPGGIQAFYEYIGRKYKVPNVKDLAGMIFVTFVVEKDGSLTDIKVIRDIGYDTGREAIRVLKSSPKWSPAQQNGKPVRVLFSLPIKIQAR